VVAILPSPDGLLVGFRVSPGARTTCCAGAYGDRIKVRIAAPPEDNRANRALVEALAKWLDEPIEAITVRSGHSSKDKVLCFKGLNPGELERELARLIATAGADRGRP